MRSAEELAKMVQQRDGVIADSRKIREFLDRKIERLEREVAALRVENNDLSACCRDMIDEKRDNPTMVSVHAGWYDGFASVLNEILYGDTSINPIEALERISVEWEKGNADLVPYEPMPVDDGKLVMLPSEN